MRPSVLTLRNPGQLERRAARSRDVPTGHRRFDDAPVVDASTL
jgi:hypothetical protein